MSSPPSCRHRLHFVTAFMSSPPSCRHRLHVVPFLSVHLDSGLVISIHLREYQSVLSGLCSVCFCPNEGLSVCILVLSVCTSAFLYVCILVFIVIYDSKV